MILYKLSKMQEKLNKNISERHNLNMDDLYVKQKIALLVELGELANEIKFFKYWKKKASPNMTVPCAPCHGRGHMNGFECTFCNGSGVDKDAVSPVLEEYVDGIHFILTIALMKYKHNDEWLKDSLDEAEEKALEYQTLDAQFETLFYEISKSLYASLDFIIRLYMGLGKMLGFTEEEIYNAYIEKNRENFRRQERGY